jgi:nucleoside-triphosphatase
MSGETNFLLTGRPGVGKTTVVERLVEVGRERGASVRGVFSPEVRDDGERVGFEIVDVSTRRTETMARVGYDEPSVGKYGVDVSSVDEIAREAVVADDADLIVVDEIASMQTHSDVFVERVRGVLDSETPVVGVVQEDCETGFVGSVKERDEATLVRITERNRDDVPDELVGLVFDNEGSPQRF